MKMNIEENTTDATDAINGTGIMLYSGYLNQLVNSGSSNELHITITDSLIRSFAVALTCIGTLCNFCVLKSLLAVRSNNLKSKFLIMNMSFADVLSLVITSSDIIVYIIYGFGITDYYVRTCVTFIFRICTPVSWYFQCLASLVLALDRLYAILAPLQYYTVGYPRWLVLCIVVGTWIIPIALVLPVFVIPFMQPLKGAGSLLCYKLTAGHKAWTAVVRSNILLAIELITFCIYIMLFVLVKQMRRKNVAVTETQTRNASVSLIVTYFMVHFTSLAFYLPGPIYSLLGNIDGFKLNKSIQRLLVVLYTLNPIVDPIILSLRIPAIRAKLNRMLGFERASHHRSEEGIQPAKTQISTVAA